MKQKTNVKNKIVRTFLDHTKDLFDCCDDDRNTGKYTCPYLEVYDRIYTYLVFEEEGGKSVRQFLEQDGFEKESIDFFSKTMPRSGENKFNFQFSHRQYV